jgi:RNA polymerase sigma-70 factor (ECF subfamily)
VRGGARVPDADLVLQREVVDAFLAASRDGDFGALLAMLDPDVVVRIDGGAVRAGLSRKILGAREAAEQTLTFSRLSPFVRPALVNGAAGVVVAPRGRPFAVMGFTVRRGKIVEINVLADPVRLRQLDLTVLDE